MSPSASPSAPPMGFGSPTGGSGVGNG
jgi:hypothetical protein